MSLDLKKIILDEKKIVKEINSFLNILEGTQDKEEKKMISSQINLLKSSLKKRNSDLSKSLSKTSLVKPLKVKEVKHKEVNLPESQSKNVKVLKKIPEILELEKRTIKRFGEREKKIKRKGVKKPSAYVKTSSRIFKNISKSLSEKKIFDVLEKSLVKSNMQFVLMSYISVILFTTLLSIILGIFLFIFFLFFNFGSALPIITRATSDIGTRFLQTFWILLVVPIGTFLFMYFYPSMERRSIEGKINYELPFATIHMSAISGSMIEPSKIFSIINSTGEYPNLSKEFTKLINEIRVYGYNLVNVMRNLAFSSPSPKLAELFNGLASTINSGGEIQEFFEKRSESLLFEYKIENERRTKAAETFMDIYISIVIAAPMIFMLVLMMMKISGLGISLSTTMISIIMVLGVAIVNVIFLTFLHLKQPGG